MNNKLSMLEVEVMLHMDWDEMFRPEYTGVNGAEFPHVVAAEIAAAEEAAKATIKEVITTKAAVAARRKATAKAEKQYKAAKAEHIHKSALMGSKRYNGEYTPYKRVRNYSLIEEAYMELEDMELMAVEEEREATVNKWETINKLNKEISNLRIKLTCLETEKAGSVETLCNETIATAEGSLAYYNMMRQHHEILDIKDTISNIENEIHSIVDSLEF